MTDPTFNIGDRVQCVAVDERVRRRLEGGVYRVIKAGTIVQVQDLPGNEYTVKFDAPVGSARFGTFGATTVRRILHEADAP